MSHPDNCLCVCHHDGSETRPSDCGIRDHHGDLVSLPAGTCGCTRHDHPNVCTLEHKRNPGHHRLSSDVSLICAGHEQGIRENLRDIEDLYAELPAHITPGAGNPSDGTKHLKKSEHPALIRLDVIAMYDPRTGPMLEADDIPNIAYELGTHCEMIQMEMGWTVGAPKTVTECVAYLHRHGTVLTSDAVLLPDYMDHLRFLRRAVASAVGQSPAKPIGRCLNVDCEANLYPTPGSDVITCERCRRSYTGLDLVRLEISNERAAS